MVACAVMTSACLSGVQCPPPSGSSAAAKIGHPFLHPEQSSSSSTCSTSGGGGTGGNTCTSGLTPNNVLFALDADGNVLEYEISAANGALQLMCNTAVAAAGGLPVVSANNFLYVLSIPTTGNPEIFEFSIAHKNSGVLTPVSGQPFTVTLANGEEISEQSAFMEADPLGRFLFITNPESGLIHVFAISSTTGSVGALSEVTNSPFTVTSPNHLAVDNTGNFVYVADETDGQIDIFTLSPTGQLALASPSVFLLDQGVDAPHFLLEHPSLPVLYSANEGSIAALQIDTSSGNLTSVGGSPFSTGSVVPDFITVDSTSSFIYANDFTTATQNVDIFGETLDSGTGALTGDVPGLPIAAPSQTTEIFQVLANPAGGNIFAVVEGASTDLVASYTITTPSGALTVPATPTTVAVSNIAVANIQ